MRKSIYILLLTVLVSGFVSAQQTDTRTTVTKIADLLAQLPATSAVRLDEAMRQLERFSPADITALFKELVPPGTGNNAGVEYALNSYSYEVMLPGKEVQRTNFVNGAIAALSALKDKDNQAFAIQMLQNTGKDESISVLGQYLTDEYLAGKSARALVAIGTEQAAGALLQGLADASENSVADIVKALGDLAYSPAEQTVLNYTTSTHSGVRKAALYALSQIGAVSSHDVLARAAAAVTYAYEPDNASAAYLNYLWKLLDKGETRLVARSANQMLKTANAENQAYVRGGALQLLTEINSTKQRKALLKAAHADNVHDRRNALQLLETDLTPAVAKRLLRGLAQRSEGTQIDVLSFLAENKQLVALPFAERTLETTGTPELKKAALASLPALMGDAAVPVLLNQLTAEAGSDLGETIKMLLLTSRRSDINSLLTSALRVADRPAAQALLIDVLAARGASESSKMVVDLLHSEDASVKTAAYNALPSVVQPSDLGKLLSRLQGAKDKAAITALQQAVVTSIVRSENPAAQQRQVMEQVKTAGTQATVYFPILSRTATGLDLVLSAAQSADPNMRNTALSNLAAWSDPAALPHLIVLSREVRDAALFNQVIGGLVRLVGVADIPAEQKVLHLRDAFDVAQTPAQKNSIIRALDATKTYTALVFAGKFLDDPELKNAAATTVMNIALDVPEFYGEDVRALLEKVLVTLSGSESSYLREAINRHLNEMPVGKGFISLFNGKDLAGWKGLVANPIKRGQMDAKTLAAAQVKADEAMRTGWYVEGGELHFNGKGDNIATVRQYGNFEMLVDWKLAKDGKDGDAGVYLRGTPQVQIWDTSRVNVGAQVGSGGLYNNKKHESKPLVVADNALGEWNTFRIVMVDEKVTVYLNGVLVTDDVVLENFWDRNQPIFPVEQIELQAHGTHVSYRDIYIRELPARKFVLSDEERGDGFEVLFDGTNLDAWTGNTDAYVVSDEATLAIYPKQGSGGNLYTKETFGDFVYRFEFRLTPGANNGVGIRAPMEGDAAYLGMEIQVLDDDADMYRNLKSYQYHGSVYGIIAAKRGHLRPLGEWNQQEIFIQGDKIRVTLNGVVIVDGNLAEASKGGTLDGKKHPGLQRKSGHIAFLGHGSEVHFRNIRVKRL